MLRSVTFILFFFISLSALSWASVRFERIGRLPLVAASQSEHPESDESTRQLAENVEIEQRRLAVEVLDRLVTYERYYHSVYGHYTQLTSRLGFTLPAALENTYAIRVMEASHDRLLVSAISEVDGKVQDSATLDQDFQLRASFPIPSPRAEYLRFRALKHLRSLSEHPGTVEEGVFRGYFKFDGLAAAGVRAPVTGMRVELASAIPEDLVAPLQTGQRSGSMSTLEEAFLAQKIFRGEMGRYARDWSELSKIAAFRFDDRDRYGPDSQVPFGDAPLIEVEVLSEQDSQEVAGDRAPGSQGSGKTLEIEEVFSR
jgi:hypothetical protein